MMNCSLSHDLLQQRLDGEAIPDRAALDYHLNTCPECRGLHAAASRLEEGMRLFVPPALPTHLTTALVGQIMADQRARLRSRRIWIGSVAVAAALLLALGVSYQGTWLHTQSARLGEPIRVKELPPEVVVEGPRSLPSLSGSLFEASAAVASLTRRTASETVGQSVLLWPDAMPAPPLTSSHVVQPMLDPSAQSFKQATQGVAVAFDPVTSSARRAFSMFLREAPATDER